VIDAYRLVRERVPGVRLALVGALADDDPEGVVYLDRTRAHAAGEPDIHILTNIDGVDAREVNAFQRAASVGILKSIREGFGLTVSESLWKGVPVVGGNAGGIALQIADGVNGFLVRDIEECADRCVRLLTDRELCRRFAEAGRELVRGRFLTTRLVRDHLRLYADLIS
jgi:trehalose synthase